MEKTLSQHQISITLPSLEKVLFFNNFSSLHPGIFDGQGEVWWENRNDFRPKFLYAKNVKGMIISGVTFINSPNHNLQCYADYTEIIGVTILAPPSTGSSKVLSHNTDGIDVHGDPFYSNFEIIQ